MDLRPELTPPSISQDLWEEVCRRIKELNYLTEDLGEEAREEIAEFNRFTGRNYNRHSFREYWTVMSLEEFATEASRPDPKPAANVTVDELVEIVRRAQSIDTDLAEANYYRDVFDANVPLENAGALMHYPLDYDTETTTWGGGRPISEYDPTPEEIVRQAIAGVQWPTPGS